MIVGLSDEHQKLCRDSCELNEILKSVYLMLDE